MRDLISIGRFAQITRLSIKALHIYDSIGLLRPMAVDPSTGYRYYSISQLPQARRIRLLRSIDMPLESIHEVIHAPTPAALDAILQEHQRRIAARIAKDQQALVLLQRLIDNKTDDMAFAIQLKDLPEQPIAGIRFQATPAQESAMIPALIDELDAYAAQLGVRCPGRPPLRISHEYAEEMVDTEIAVPISQPVTGAGRIVSRVLEPGTVAFVTHIGPHADLWAVYWALLVWIAEHGYEQSGPPREVYWMHPADGNVPEYRTEVQWPVRPHEAGAAGAGYAG